MNSTESAYIVQCKEGPCMACLVWAKYGRAPLGFAPWIGCDFHHFKSGNKRRGHMFGCGLCAWHHRGVPDWGCIAPEMRIHYGPSLMDGSRLFRETYGSDDELLALQKRVNDGLQ